MNDSIEYKGYTINIVNDDSPMYPFEDFDDLPHLVAVYDNQVKQYNDSEFDIEYLPALSRQEIVENLDLIKTLLDDQRPFLFILRDYRLQSENVVDAINELLQYLYDDLSNSYRHNSASAKFEFYSDILNIKKVKHLLTESRGYCQGDYVEMLLIANDESDTIETLQGAADMYSAWAWGDVYGFTVEGIADEELLENVSCWGFYGSDHDTSGLIEHAKNAVDCEIVYNRKQKLNKLKTLIKNNVPIDKREQLLIIA